MISTQSCSTLTSEYRLPFLLMGYGSTLGFDSEEDSQPSESHRIHHIGAAIRPNSLENWFMTKFAEKTERAMWPYQAYQLRIEAPRSDANFNVFTEIEKPNQNPWGILKSEPSDFTDDPTHPTSQQAQFMAEFAAKKRDSLRIGQAYQVRIEELRSYAEFDDLTINEASERDFWSFIMSMPFAREAELVLLDNGNLRAIWDDENGNHFGLQFLGERELQYVIFRHRKGYHKISRVAGRDTFDSVKRQVRTFELDTLLHI